MAANLTWEEARLRAERIRVVSYRIELDLTGGGTTFRSVSRVAFDARRPGDATFVNLIAPAVHAITLNGKEVSPGAFDGGRIVLDGLAARNELVVDADCAYSRSGEGLHRFTDPVDGRIYLYSDLETFDAQRVYACFDQPNLKASFEFVVLALKDWVVVSNLAPVTDGGEDVPGRPGMRRWDFPPSPVMPTYITHVSAGPYHRVRDEHDSIPLGLYCRRSLAEHLDPNEIFPIIKKGFDFYHDTFRIRYPFGKYDQLFVPEFKTGAMENAGAVTIAETCVFRSRVTDYSRQGRAEIMLHELAHMWFGNLVTMCWWNDLWLNESFATWAAALCQSEATRWTFAWATFAQADAAELSSDATDNGQRHAAACRAALPSAAAKRTAWAALIGGELTLPMLRAVLSGFTDPDQPELTEDFRAPYFEAIGRVWRNWSPAMAHEFAEAAYLVCPLTAETVAATEAYLSAARPPTALRRLLIEGRDDVVRSLRCQDRDRLASNG